MDWHQAHWLELARQSSQVRRLGVRSEDRVTPWLVYTPPHTRSLGPVGLTGCRVGDTPPGSSGHPDPGPAGCMLHPLFGWCSDATHRRGPGGWRRAQFSPLPWALSALPPSPAPPLRPPLQALTPPTACLSFPLQISANNIHGSCLLSTLSLFGHKHPFVRSRWGLIQSLGSRDR